MSERAAWVGGGGAFTRSTFNMTEEQDYVHTSIEELTKAQRPQWIAESPGRFIIKDTKVGNIHTFSPGSPFSPGTPFENSTH